MILRKTKTLFFFSFLTLALLTAGLFLFQQKISQPSKELETQNMKPEDFNFSEKNQLQHSGGELGEKNSPSPQASEPQTSAVATSEPIQLNEQDQKIWQTFNQILISKNDNDPALDHDLKHTSATFHRELYRKYESLSAEDRNGKGLIAFLISRDMNSTEDAQFLKNIYQEEPCLSLDDCKNPGKSDPHHSSVEQTTLQYPQLASLYQIETQLSQHPEILQNDVKKRQIIEIVAAAESFPVPVIQQKAKEIRQKFKL